MSNAIVNYSEYSDVELNKLLGIDPNITSGGGTTRLLINALSEDDEGKALTMGSFYLTNLAGQEEPIYAKEVTIRVLMPSYQYRQWDAKEEKIVAQSIMSNSLNAEFISDNGKIRCGKLTKAKAEKGPLTPEQLKLQEEVKCKLSLWVLVSYTGKTQDGREAEVADVPALWTLSQSGFREAATLLEGFTKGKRSPLRYDVKVTLRKEKNGSVIYYIPIFVVDSEAKPLPNNVADLIKNVGEFIKRVNVKITDGYNTVLSGEKKTTDAVDVVKEFNRPMPNSRKGKTIDVVPEELNDELPW